MTKSRITRRGALKASLMTATLAGTASLFGPWQHNRVWAQGTKKPIKLGLTCDASGQYGNSGQDDLRGMRMAIDEFNAKGGVLGRKVEWITADTETNPATGTRVAERFIAQEQCGFLIGALHSGVANAITQVANKYGTIYMNTNSSAPSEAGENCSRVKFVWDGNGTNFSKAAVASAVQKIGKRWLLLTNDYVWGHTTAAATKAEVEKSGGQIVDNLLVPQNTRDFTAYLLNIQQIKPDVIAMAIGGDDIKALRQQISELKLEDKAAWINNQQDWPDIWGVPETLFGVFGTNWYHKLPLPGVPGVREALANGLSAVADPGAGQRFLQRLHGDPRAAARHRADRLDQQHRPHQGAGRPQDGCGRPHAELRRLYRSGHPPDPADDLSRAAQSQAGRQHRPVRDSERRDARAGARHRVADHLQAEAVRRRSDLRAIGHLKRRARSVSIVGLLPHLVNGLALGLLFALLALGFMLILGLMEQINLAHGSLFALGAYFAYAIATPRLPLPPDMLAVWAAVPLGWRFTAAMFLAPVLVAPFGVVLERMMRRTYGRDPLYGLLLTFGMAMVLEELIRTVWGTRDYMLPVPRGISGGFLMLDLIWSTYRFWAAGFAIIAMAVVWVVIERTRLSAHWSKPVPMTARWSARWVTISRSCASGCSYWAP